MRTDVCTVSELMRPMMGRPNIDNAEGLCCWCGRPATDRHHIVKRSAGKLVKNGREVPKPTARLCGFGNASGCHGKAHAGRLHFRWVDHQETPIEIFRNGSYPGRGHWEALETSEPCKYQQALEMEGWRRI